MVANILRFVSYAFALLAVGGLGYLLLTLWSIWRYTRRRIPVADFAPPVSLLKPLKGLDPEMYEAFRSHCLQDYPQYEIIFGVNDAHDEAIAAVEKLKAEFPERSIELVICPEAFGTNRKVSNLLQMAKAARFSHLVINDGDIRVPSNYLREVMGPFADEKTGMVTALYRGVAARTLGSRLEAVTIGTDFAGGVLCAMTIERGLHFALGSTLAISQTVLEKIGGLTPLLDYLADDYELGVRTSKAGFEVQLANVVVETNLHPYTMGEMFDHQLRWARTMRDLRKGGYAGVLFTFALPWAILATLFSGGSVWSWALLAVVFVIRMIAAYLLCASVLQDRRTLRDLWLVPLRDFVGVLVWLASYAGNTITWRGEKFKIADGKLTRG